MKKLLESTIDKFRLGDAMTYRNLCLFPLFEGDDMPPEYLSLKTALERKLVEITEVSEAGSVPNLKVLSQAEVPVLLIDGEELKGAKQNRVVNTSLLLAAKSETVIPVSCTEAGRWRYDTPGFSESGYMMSSESRINKSRRLHQSLKAFQKYDANQSEVWNDVRHLHASSRTFSSTGAMSDAYEQKQGDLEEFMKAFPLLDGQKGLVVFMNGKLIGVDYVSRHDVYKDLHEKLVKSHVVVALYKDTSLFDSVNLQIDAHLFLQSLAETPDSDEFKPVGLGADLRFDTPAAGGAALVFEGKVIHLTAFRKPGVEQRQGSTDEERSQVSLTDRLRRRFVSIF
jgi:hypothetical protein